MHVVGPDNPKVETPLTQICAPLNAGPNATVIVAVPCPDVIVAFPLGIVHWYPLVPGIGQEATEYVAVVLGHARIGPTKHDAASTVPRICAEALFERPHALPATTRI